MNKIAEVTQGNWQGLVGEVTKESKKLVYVRKPDGKGSAIVNRADVIEVEVQQPTVDLTTLTMTNGYVGQMGKSWETPTPETFELAVTGAMQMNSMTREQVIAALAAGQALNWCKSSNFYYDHSMGQILRKRTAKPVEMVHCDCGHSVERGLVMTTSQGASCPDCYDRMSD
jgi:RNase P/RNase MRP subunit p29